MALYSYQEWHVRTFLAHSRSALIFFSMFKKHYLKRSLSD
jgi:hypothetical protein